MHEKSLDCSVIICCYNPNLEQLKETIISIVRQRGCSYEIIVADDGSKTDYIHELKQWNGQFKDVQFVYSFLPSNKGTVINLLSALELASSEVVKTISPGDYLFSEDVLEKYLECYRTNKADLIFGDVVYYKNFSTLYQSKIPHCRMTYSPRYMKRNILVFNDHLHGASFFLNKQTAIECLKKVVGTVRLAEDISLVNICLLTNKNIKYLKKDVVWYEHGTGVSVIKGADSPMKQDSEDLWAYLRETYDIEDIYERRKMYLSNTNAFMKMLTIPGYTTYMFFSVVTLLQRNIQFLFRQAFKSKWLMKLKKMVNLPGGQYGK